MILEFFEIFKNIDIGLFFRNFREFWYWIFFEIFLNFYLDYYFLNIHEFLYWIIFSKNLSRKPKHYQNLTRTTGTLYVNPNTFMISRSFLFKMKFQKQKIVEKIKTNFIFNDIFPKIVPYMRQCRNRWYRRTAHSWQYKTAYVFCILDE